MTYFIQCIIPAIIFAAAVLSVYILEIRLWIQAYRKKSIRCLTHWSAWILHILSITGLVCLSWGYFVEPYRLEVTHIPIYTDKLKNASLRIVQISDLHCDRKERLEPKLPEIVNELNPDLIVFTGDAVNTPRSLPLFRETLSQMHAPLGQYGVNGNHDMKVCPETDLFIDSGFKELKLDTVLLEKEGESIGLCGVDYLNGKISFKAIKQLKEDQFNVLLYHTPDLIDYLDNTPIDLYLCGHTHGGQIALPFYGAIITQSSHGKRYEAGLYQVGHITFYINRGIGMTGGPLPRIRFLATPEVTVFDIQPKTPDQWNGLN